MKRGRGRPPLTDEQRAERAAERAAGGGERKHRAAKSEPIEPGDLRALHEMVGELVGMLPGVGLPDDDEYDRLDRLGARADLYPPGKFMARLLYGLAGARTYAFRVGRWLWGFLTTKPEKTVVGPEVSGGGPGESLPVSVGAPAGSAPPVRPLDWRGEGSPIQRVRQ